MAPGSPRYASQSTCGISSPTQTSSTVLPSTPDPSTAAAKRPKGGALRKEPTPPRITVLGALPPPPPTIQENPTRGATCTSEGRRSVRRWKSESTAALYAGICGAPEVSALRPAISCSRCCGRQELPR
jgi:hypothetical protein